MFFFCIVSMAEKISTTSIATQTTSPSARGKILFIVQVSAILLVVICSLINLSISYNLPHMDKKDDKLWIVLLSSTIGYLLPNPKLKSGLKTINI